MRFDIERDSYEYRISSKGEFNGKLVEFNNVTIGNFKGKTFMGVKSESKQWSEELNRFIRCTETEYYLLVTEMESHKKPRGLCYIVVPTSVECDDKHYNAKEIFFNTAIEKEFSGCWNDDIIKYKGYSYDQHWNGWECPYFTKETCFAILFDIGELDEQGRWVQGEMTYWYNKEDDTFYEQREGDEPYPLGSPSEVNGVHVYDLGAMSWCWCEA